MSRDAAADGVADGASTSLRVTAAPFAPSRAPSTSRETSTPSDGGRGRGARGRGAAGRGRGRGRGRAGGDGGSGGASGGANGGASRGAGAVRADFLLNFSLPPRERERESTRRRGVYGAGSVGAKGSARARTAVYKKELFLQANFRFLVADSADLRKSAHDADHMVSWEDVVQVECGSVDALSCPICFDDAPTAPQMTVCGHSFCFPCIARHILTTRSDGKPAKCPMCFTEIRLADLRSVRRRAIHPTGVGNVQKFVLMCRQRNSHVPGRKTAKVTAPPRAGEWPRALPDCGCDAFAKYTLTNEEVAIATQELESLESYIAVLTEHSDVAELPYALASVDALSRRIDRMIERRCMSEGAPCPPPRSRPVGVVAPAVEVPSSKEVPVAPQFPALPPSRKNMAYIAGSKVRVESAFTDDEDEIDDDEDDDEEEDDENETICDAPASPSSPTTVIDAPPSDPAPEDEAKKPSSAANERTDVYYFYQSPDGQQVLLHGACMRVLLEHYGSYGALPLEIDGVVVDMERNTQDEDSRRRAAHIRHIPLTTEYVMVELDMTPHVPKRVLDGASGSELRQRAKRRAQKSAAEARSKSKELRAEALAKAKSQPFSKSIRDAMPELGASPRADTSMDAAFARMLLEEESEQLERMAMYEEVAHAQGPRGTSFSNVVGRGFASGVDAPSLNFNTGDRFGPALGAAPQPVTASAPVWGARTSSADFTIPEPTDESRKKKGKNKGTVLFRIG